jgi:hypothetical protein
VDLFYETRIVCLAVLASAVLTATALAMSGLKMMMRLLWAAKIVIVNFILMGVILSGALASGTLMKEVNAFGWEWLVLVFGASLASGVFLRLAGDLMDAPSANGAMVPRLGVVLGCGVLPFLSALGLNAGFQMMYAGMLCYLSTWVFIWHLHGQRPLLKVHLLPFRKLGAFLGRIAAFLLLPNWVGVSLLLFLPASGVLYLLWVASKPGKFEWVLVGIVLHVASYALCLIVLWRLFFATKRDSHGAVHERDPRLVLGWLMAISSLFAPISQISPLVPSMRLVGVFVPLLFTWAYSKSENLGVADVDVPDFLRITALSFSLYLLLSVWLGARWLQKNKTWQLFWSKAAVSDGPSADQSGAPPSTGPGA